MKFILWDGDDLINGKPIEVFSGTNDRFLVIGEIFGMKSNYTLNVKKMIHVPALEFFAQVSTLVKVSSKDNRVVSGTMSSYTTTKQGNKSVTEKRVVPISVAVMSEKVYDAVALGSMLLASGSLAFLDGELHIAEASVCFVDRGSPESPVTPSVTPVKKFVTG